MERFLNWTGLLVEAYDESFKILMGRNRKAYAVPTCLSTKPYPIEVYKQLLFIIFKIISFNLK